MITALVGFGVGGNIPIDTTICLEFIPQVCILLPVSVPRAGFPCVGVANMEADTIPEPPVLLGTPLYFPATRSGCNDRYLLWPHTEI